MKRVLVQLFLGALCFGACGGGDSKTTVKDGGTAKDMATSDVKPPVGDTALIVDTPVVTPSEDASQRDTNRNTQGDTNRNQGDTNRNQGDTNRNQGDTNRNTDTNRTPRDGGNSDTPIVDAPVDGVSDAKDGGGDA